MVSNEILCNGPLASTNSCVYLFSFVSPALGRGRRIPPQSPINMVSEVCETVLWWRKEGRSETVTINQVQVKMVPHAQQQNRTERVGYLLPT